jgi:cbb3-type cytochrome oxidase maturation protein
MSALVVLIAASLILASVFLFAFIRATKKGQYEDVYTPSVRILFEDFEDRQKTRGNLDEGKNENDEYEPSVPKNEKRIKKNLKSKWN